MNDKDRRSLEAMDTRELADIGISRSDLPRLYAASSFRSCLPAAANLEEVTRNPTRRRIGRHHGHKTSLIRAGSVVSAVLITWAIVHAVAQGADPMEALLDDASWPCIESGVVARTGQLPDQLAHVPLNSGHSLARGTTS
jgi:hypothetical protein